MGGADILHKYIKLPFYIAGLIFMASCCFADIVNPGFEEGTEGWTVPSAVAQIDNTTSHSGAKSLKISYDDPAKRQFASQKLALKPGKRYLVSAWIKCSGVMGAYNGATVGIEYWKGKDFVGGSSQIGIGYDRDWTHIMFISDPVNEGANIFEVYACIDWGGKGTAWFDDISVTEVPDIAKPKLEVRNPVIVGDKDSPDFEVSIQGMDTSIFKQDVVYSVSLCAPAWNTVVKEQILSSSGTVRFSTVDLCEGEYRIALDIKGKDNNRPLISQQITKVWKRPPAEFLLNPHSSILTAEDGMPSIDIRAYRTGFVAGKITCPDGKSAYIESRKITAGKDSIIKLKQMPLSPGKYKITLGFSSTGHSGYTCNIPFTVLSRNDADKAVMIGRDNLLRIKGKVWFPMFIYAHTAMDNKTYAELDKRSPELEKDLLDHIQGTPFGILDYATPTGGLEETVRFADECAKRNIKLALSIKDVYPNWGNLQKRQKDFAAGSNSPDQIVRQLATSLKDNPALAVYYTNDELATLYYNQLKDRRNLLHEVDPLHPVLSVHYELGYIRELADTYDIFGPELYPPVADKLKDMADWSDKVTSSLPKSAPFWGCLWHFRGDPQGSEKLRALTYISIARGARGLLFYAYYEFKGDSNFEKRWADLTALGKEVESQLPILLQPESGSKCKSRNSNLILRTVSGSQGTYLLAVNSTSAKLSTDVVLPAGFTKAQMANKSYTVINGSMRISLKPFDVALIKLQ